MKEYTYSQSRQRCIQTIMKVSSWNHLSLSYELTLKDYKVNLQA